MCGKLVGRRPRPSAEVSRADCSRKSGVALPKREICGMANAIPAIPSPPPMEHMVLAGDAQYIALRDA